MYGPWAEESVQPIIAIYVLWLVWFLAWLGASVGTVRIGKRLPILREIIFRVLAILGTLLLFSFTPWPGLDVQYQLWRPLAAADGWGLVLLTFLGFAFAAWGRGQLGWSSDPSHKEELRVVETGPYRLVRQPIYLGVIIAAFASALVFGRPSSLAGAALLTVAFLVKSYMEEGQMRSELGAYDDYAERVPMMVPFHLGWFRSKRDEPAPGLRRIVEPAKPELDLFPAALATPVAASGPQIAVPVPAPADETPKSQLDLFAPAPAAEAEHESDEPPAAAAEDAEPEVEIAGERAQPEASEAMSMTNR